MATGGCSSKRSNGPRRRPEAGRSITSLARRKDLDATTKKLKAKGVRSETGPADVAADRLVFVVGPDGVRIKLVGHAAQ